MPSRAIEVITSLVAVIQGLMRSSVHLNKERRQTLEEAKAYLREELPNPIPRDDLPDAVNVVHIERAEEGQIRLVVFDVAEDLESSPRRVLFSVVDIIEAEDVRTALIPVIRAQYDRLFVRTGDGLYLEPDYITLEEALEAALPIVETSP